MVYSLVSLVFICFQRLSGVARDGTQYHWTTACKCCWLCQLRLFPGGVSNSPSDYEFLLDTFRKTGQCGAVIQLFLMTHDSSVSNYAWKKFTQLLPVQSSDKEKLHNTQITEMSCTGVRKWHVYYITGLAHINSSMLAGAFRRSSLACRTTSRKNCRMLFESLYFRQNEHALYLVWAMCQEEHMWKFDSTFPFQACPGNTTRAATSSKAVELDGSLSRDMSRDVGPMGPNTKGLGNSPYDCAFLK